MNRHKNPYRIHNPNDIFEVSENSSHPELKDRKRIYDFKGRVFKTSQHLLNYFDSEGLDPRKFWMLPKWEKDISGATIIRINIVERVSPQERMQVREMSELYAC